MTKFVFLAFVNMVTLKAGAKHELFSNKLASYHFPIDTRHPRNKTTILTSPKCLKFRGGFVEQKLMLRPGFRCDQIHNCQRFLMILSEVAQKKMYHDTGPDCIMPNFF